MRESLKSNELVELASIVLAPALTLCSEPPVGAPTGPPAPMLGGPLEGGSDAEGGFSCARYGFDTGAGDDLERRRLTQ